MWNVRLPRLDILTEEQAGAIDDVAMTLLEEVGFRFIYEPALELFRAAGLDVEGDLVRLDRGFVKEQLALAPASFEVRGRNPERNVIIGGRYLALAPTGGAPFVLDPEVGRRPPTAEDHRTFVRFTHAVPQLHVNGSGIVEPDDLPVASRHLDMEYDTLRWSDKPYTPVGASAASSRDSVELAAIAFGGLEEIRGAPVMLGIVNPVSPLLYDERMTGSLMEYAKGGQPVILMPFVFAGGTAPLGLAGAVAQMAAEVLAGVALVQLTRPGAPCVYGSSVSELNLHDGQPRYATAGHGLAMLASGQMARRYELPFRGAAGSPRRRRPTSARCRSRSWHSGLPCSRVRTSYCMPRDGSKVPSRLRSRRWRRTSPPWRCSSGSSPWISPLTRRRCRSTRSARSGRAGRSSARSTRSGISASRCGAAVRAARVEELPRPVRRPGDRSGRRRSATRVHGASQARAGRRDGLRDPVRAASNAPYVSAPIICCNSASESSPVCCDETVPSEFTK